MDFLDPKKQKAYRIRMIIGYCLVAIALLLATTVLVELASGYGIDKNGQIIQNGLIFMSSTPSPAQIYIDGTRYKSDTNVRIPLPSGQYTVELRRSGYITWKRAISVDGGVVTHYDYPFLFPTKLQTTALKSYDSKMNLATQSPDRHWGLLQQGSSLKHFEVYDLTQPKQAPKDITLPDTVLATAQTGTAESWSLVQWSTDNKHVVLKHNFTKNGQPAYEYILVDRSDASQSVNLTQAWGVNPTSVELRNQHYDQYYLYDQANQTLDTATLKQPSPQSYLDHVLAFKSYGDNIMLYATTKNAPPGKVDVVWHDGSNNYTLKTINASAAGQYLLDLTQYSGDWYVAVGDPTDGKVYIYKNPADVIGAKAILVPVHILKAPGATYLDFSDNARFIMAENGSQFAVYDAENDKGFVYDQAAKMPLDAPQTHAIWMDGHRLTYVSKGKLVVFDFDSANPVTLNAADSSYLPMFSNDYKYVYTIGASADAQKPANFDQTALRTPQDL